MLLSLHALGQVMTRAGRFAEAEALLLEAREADESDSIRQSLVELYRAWDAAEPGRGYAAKAEPYRDRS